MTSDRSPSSAYVWVWLPSASAPVVAGVLEAVGDTVLFTYGRSYLARPDAISLYEPELPLRAGRIRPLPGLDLAGCINDASPDAWGQRVIMHRILGQEARSSDPTDIGPLTYLLEGLQRRSRVDAP
jgi:serine/threonine-protein kinase HipA